MQYRNILSALLLLPLAPLVGAASAAPAELHAAAAEKGYLGVSITEDDGAVRVVETYPDTAAAAAGIQAGDLLLAVDERSFDDLGGLREALGSHEPGDSVLVRIRRGEEELELGVVLGRRPGPAASERREAPRVRLEHLKPDEPALHARDDEGHAPRIHVEHGDHHGSRIKIERVEGGEPVVRIEGLGDGEHEIRIEREDGEEPRVYVWRSGDQGLHEIEPGQDGYPEELERFHEEREAFEEQWQSQLDRHMAELHEHLQNGMGKLHERLRGLHTHEGDDVHPDARQHWNRARKELERWNADHEDQLKGLHSRMRTFRMPRVEIPEIRVPRADAPSWFGWFGDGDEYVRPRAYRFGGDDEVGELRETVGELRDELRGLREELRALREELRNR